MYTCLYFECYKRLSLPPNICFLNLDISGLFQLRFHILKMSLNIIIAFNIELLPVCHMILFYMSQAKISQVSHVLLALHVNPHVHELLYLVRNSQCVILR